MIHIFHFIYSNERHSTPFLFCCSLSSYHRFIITISFLVIYRASLKNSLEHVHFIWFNINNPFEHWNVYERFKQKIFICNSLYKLISTYARLHVLYVILKKIKLAIWMNWIYCSMAHVHQRKNWMQFFHLHEFHATVETRLVNIIVQ